MSNVIQFPRPHTNLLSDLMQRHWMVEDESRSKYMNWLDARIADATRRRSEWPFDGAETEAR